LLLIIKHAPTISLATEYRNGILKQ